MKRVLIFVAWMMAMMTCPVNAQDAQIIKVSENDEPMQKGKFEPNWE